MQCQTKLELEVNHQQLKEKYESETKELRDKIEENFHRNKKGMAKMKEDHEHLVEEMRANHMEALTGREQELHQVAKLLVCQYFKGIVGKRKYHCTDCTDWFCLHCSSSFDLLVFSSTKTEKARMSDVWSGTNVDIE